VITAEEGSLNRSQSNPSGAGRDWAWSTDAENTLWTRKLNRNRENVIFSGLYISLFRDGKGQV